MTPFEIFLAGAILIAAILQVAVLYLLYRVVARLADRTDRLLTKLEPEIEDLATAVRAVRRAVEVSSQELEEHPRGCSRGDRRARRDRARAGTRTRSSRRQGLGRRGTPDR